MKEWPKEWTRVPEFASTKETIYEKKYYHSGGVARITFNTPERLNAITIHGMEEVVMELSDADADDSIGAVVLTGAGDRAFCVGGALQHEIDELPRDLLWRIEPVSMDVAVVRCLKPIIAAVKGYCIGGGHHLAYFCDLTIAADNAVFGQVGPKMGSAADGFIMAYLPRVVGAKKAKEIWMLCRQYTAQEALEMGLANKVVPLDKLDEEVEKVCLELLDKSPTCMKILKASFGADIQYMMATRQYFANMIGPHYPGSEEQMSAMKAAQEKAGKGQRKTADFGKFRGRPADF